MLPYLLYSLSLLLVWSLSYFASGQVTNFGILLALLYTFYSAYFIRHFVEEETRKLKCIKMLGPSFILGVGFWAYSVQEIPYNWFYHQHILLLSCTLLLLSLFDSKPRPSLALQLLLWPLLLLYTFWVHPWIENRNSQLLSGGTYNFTSQTKEASLLQAPPPPREDCSLQEFRFVNQALDTLSLEPGKKFTVLELWSYTGLGQGVSSYLSFRDMSDFWAAQKDLAYYPVFASADLGRELNYDKLFKYPAIQEQAQIHIDLALVDSLQIRKFPTYLVFDQDAQLVFKLEGYEQHRRWAIQTQFREVLQ